MTPTAIGQPGKRYVATWDDEGYWEVVLPANATFADLKATSVIVKAIAEFTAPCRESMAEAAAMRNSLED